MTTHHTPGPWHTGGVNPISAPVIYAADGFAVADATVYHRHHDGQTAANAALIAAAPEMLAALRVAHEALTDAAEDGEFWRENAPADLATLAAAIAKAEGRA